MTMRPIVVPFGDAGVLVDLGGEPGAAMSRRLMAVARLIGEATQGMPGWERAVPAATSVLVPVDPVDPGVAAAIVRVRALVGRARPAEILAPDDGASPIIEIPVRYGGPDGPDLETVAGLTGLTPAAVVRAHASVTYTALFLGFAPGFAYLGPLPPQLVLERRAEPRQLVPAGSVAIAGPQTAVYPLDSPGGWWILGRTTTRVWDPGRDRAALIEPGARVRFVAEPAQ